LVELYKGNYPYLKEAMHLQYEFRINHRTTLGFRLDFANYNHGDINTLAAKKLGLAFNKGFLIFATWQS
jgi:hypothetical protein